MLDVFSVVKCVFTTQMLCFDINRHGPTTLGRDDKSRTMWMCSVPRGYHQSSIQDEDKMEPFYTVIPCVIVKSCQAIVVHQLVQSWLVRLVVYNFASYGPELYAGTATPDASINSHIVIEKSQGRVNLV